jgi:hypothetical protein
MLPQQAHSDNMIRVAPKQLEVDCIGGHPEFRPFSSRCAVTGPYGIVIRLIASIWRLMTIPYISLRIRVSGMGGTAGCLMSWRGSGRASGYRTNRHRIGGTSKYEI